MKVLTPASTSNSQHNKNSGSGVMTGLTNSKTKTIICQQTADNNNAKKSSGIKCVHESNCNNKDNNNSKSLQTSKQYNLNNSHNKNGKKSNSHMYYNIPTTTNSSNRKKYYQQHRYNQQQYNFLNNSKDNIKTTKNTTPKNKKLEADIVDISNPLQQLSKVISNSLTQAEDFVNNNTPTTTTQTTTTTSLLLNDNTTICKHGYNNVDISIVGSSIALSSHRVKSEFKQHDAPSITTPKTEEATILIASSDTTLPAAKITGKHYCLGEYSNINLDCNSCWTNLVNPPSTDLQGWSWTDVNRYKSPSVSSISSYSSTASSSISAALAVSNSEVLHNNYTTNVNNESYADKNNTKKKKSLRKGNTGNSTSGNTNAEDTNNNNRSSLQIKGQHQQLQISSNTSSTTDDSQENYVSAVSANDVPVGNIHSVENSKGKKTAMTTAFTSTVSTTASTASTVTKTTIVAENVNTSLKSSSNVTTPLTIPSSSSTLSNEIAAVEEFSTRSTTPTPTTIPLTSTSTSGSTSRTRASDSSSSTISTLERSSGSPGPTSTNSYTLDFLHSVGEQMTGSGNLATYSKNSSTTTMRTTTFSNENPAMVSPSRTNSYSYQNIAPHRPHTMSTRYMSNSGGIGMISNIGNNNSHIHTREQRGHRFQHHHQPHPLTLGAFMQKELINETFIGGGGGVGAGVGGGSSRGVNSGNKSINGSGDSGIVDVNNNNNNADYTNHQTYRNHQRYHNYYQSHYQQSHQQQQQRLSAAQHEYSNTTSTYHNEIGNDGIARIIRNGSSSNQTQNAKHRIYQSQSYQNNGESPSNSYQSHHQHHNLLEEDINVAENENVANENISGAQRNNVTNNNSRSSQQSQQKMSNTKKSNYISSSTSSCSSSSASSSSSNSSQASTTSSNRQQKIKSTSQMNLVIETLPKKNNSYTQRYHRLQQSNYPNPQHHSLQYSAGIVAASTAQQSHQNIHNLTYVNTEALTINTNLGISTTAHSRSCSPSLSPSTSSTPGIQHSPNHLHYRQQHHHHQQSYVHGKRLTTVPFALNVSATRGIASHSTSPVGMGNIICYTQLNDSATSCDSNQQPKNVHGTTGHDYDDSDSSSNNSTAFSQQQRTNQQQTKNSISLSSSSSASSISSTAAIRNYNVQQPGMAMVAVPHIQSPDHAEFSYNHNFATTSQHYTLQPQPLSPSTQHQQQQQSTHFRSNGIISMFNVSLNNNCIADDELMKQQQPQIKHQGIHHQQRHFYFTSAEHLNATPISAHCGNSGYWSPLQHSNFLYPQTNLISSVPPCPTPTAALSPCLSDQDDHHHHLHPLNNQQQQQQLNIVNNQSEALSSTGHLKRSSTPQMTSAAKPQQQHQQQQPLQHHRLPQQSTISQGGMAATATNVASLRQRNGGRNQPQVAAATVAAPQPPPTPIPHVYTQHNLLFGPQTHIRSAVNASHEFFTHTPPDRFLARAHLIEAKETPNTLLNNTKWDNLSQGIWNKFMNSQQTEETFKQKMRLWRYLYIIIKNTYPRFGLYLVGSTISGFGADTSDVDMCLVSRSASTVEPRMEALINLTVLRDYLSKSAEFENFNLIEAKVPILRFRDRVHQLEVDLNFNNCVGIKNTHLLYCYSQLDWRLRPLVLVTKLWAQYHNINNAKNMTISSYSLVLMVIHFLQYAVSPVVLPCLHDMFPEKFPLLRSNDFGFVDMNETMSPYESKNTQTIGELFLSFLEYYSCFDYTQFAISIRTGGLLPINVCRLAKSLKNDIHQWKELCIEEPFDLTNTARSVYDFETFERVKAVFVASWRILQQTLDLSSIFAPIALPPTNQSVPPTLSTRVQYVDQNSKMPSERGENDVQLLVNGSTITISQDTNSLDSLQSDKEQHHVVNENTFNNKEESQRDSGSLTKLVS